MKNVVYRVATAIIAVNELRHIYNRGDRDTIEASTIAYWGLIDFICNEYGISRKDVYTQLLLIGYEHKEAVDILDGYELWAMRQKEIMTDEDVKNT
jgi:hypothetical protein